MSDKDAHTGTRGRRNGGNGKRGAREDAVLLDRQYAWPGDLTEIPDWVYTDESIYRRDERSGSRPR